MTTYKAMRDWAREQDNEVRERMRIKSARSSKRQENSKSPHVKERSKHVDIKRSFLDQ